MDVRSFLREITTDRRYRGQIVHVQRLSPREARYAEPRHAIGDALASLLRRQNIHHLYTHQATVILHAFARQLEGA